MLDTILGWLKSILGAVLFFLPDDPFMPFIEVMAGHELLGFLNWFIPIGTMVSIGGAWLIAIGVFYVYQAILRWVKVVGS
jgi:hypothetical protein